jgi:hypothetical protein
MVLVLKSNCRSILQLPRIAQRSLKFKSAKDEFVKVQYRCQHPIGVSEHMAAYIRPPNHCHRNRIPSTTCQIITNTKLILSHLIQDQSHNRFQIQQEHEEHWWNPSFTRIKNWSEFNEVLRDSSLNLHHRTWDTAIPVWICHQSSKSTRSQWRRRRNRRLSSISEEEEDQELIYFQFLCRTYQKHQKHIKDTRFPKNLVRISKSNSGKYTNPSRLVRNRHRRFWMEDKRWIEVEIRKDSRKLKRNPNFKNHEDSPFIFRIKA